MRKLTIILFVAIFLVFNIFAMGDEDVLNSGTTAAPFLKIGVGARSSAMGGSVLTSVDDADAVYWNPAGLMNVKKGSTVTFTHNQWIADITHEYLGFTIPAGEGNLGFAINAINYPEQDETSITADNFETGNQFKPIDVSMNVSYARQLSKNVSFGVTGKYIYSKIKNLKASAFALDFGAIYDTGWKNLKLGFVFRNFGTQMRYLGRDLQYERTLIEEREGTQTDYTMSVKTDHYSLPVSLELALGWEKSYGTNHVMAEYRYMHQNDYAVQHSIGVEYSYTEYDFVPYLRAGAYLNNYEHELNTGAGLRYNMEDVTFDIDYSVQDYNRLGLIHKFTVGMEF